MTEKNFTPLYERLKSILQAHAGGLNELPGEGERYELTGPYLPKFKKDLWFGMVNTGKAYVSYHLMPVYMYPDLLDGASEALKKRMQGKSCFNFTKIDEPLFAELDELTRRSIERCVKEGILK
ncbi:MAG: hypothetical protein HY835_00560 [Anaerolineae bacterium]|nr:hypothetical protein [Anaerolineae bacterium]